jgi:hypothetical protein
MSFAIDTDECDPPTDVHAFDASDATIASARATQDLHHLTALLATLTPLRARYVAAAIDPLRALPIEALRAVLPHVLREHPALLSDARVRAVADDVLLDTDAAADRPDVVRWLARIGGVRASSATDALARAEAALVVLASGVAELSRARNELRTSLVGDGVTLSSHSVPEDATEVLARALGGGVAQARPMTEAMAELVLHAMAVPSAARDAAAAITATTDERWWPRAVRAVAGWVDSLAGRTPTERFELAFARAYVARSGEEA